MSWKQLIFLSSICLSYSTMAYAQPADITSSPSLSQTFTTSDQATVSTVSMLVAQRFAFPWDGFMVNDIAATSSNIYVSRYYNGGSAMGDFIVECADIPAPSDPHGAVCKTPIYRDLNLHGYIHKISPNNGNIVATFQLPTTGSYVNTLGVSYDKSKLLLSERYPDSGHAITDVNINWADRITEFDPTAEQFRTVLDLRGTDLQLTSPREFADDMHGNIWFTMLKNNGVARYNRNTNNLSIFAPSYPAANLFVDPDGSGVWFKSNTSVVKVKTDGSMTEFAMPNLGSACKIWRMALGITNNIFLAGGCGASPTIFNMSRSDGSFTSMTGFFYEPPATNYIGGIAQSSEGRLWTVGNTAASFIYQGSKSHSTLDYFAQIDTSKMIIGPKVSGKDTVWYSGLNVSYGKLTFNQGTDPTPTPTPAPNPQIADLNRDSFPDSVFFRPSNFTPTLKDASGIGKVTRVFEFPQIMASYSITDLDQDGILDIVAFTSVGTNRYLFRGLGDGTFTSGQKQ